ncbi:MAG: ABC transporter permease subunit [Verrucomicrobia bacterium]|nr:MAG: ABC transporter permease subunit [Verrucomicrobiota bacterium]
MGLYTTMAAAGTDPRTAYFGGRVRQNHPHRKGGIAMRVYLTLLRRELASHFVSLTGYVIISVVLLLLGFSILDMLPKLNGDPTDTPITRIFYATVYFWMLMLLTTPIMTMRTFAQEKFTGTFETLMTTPVSDLEVVLAKFTGALIFFMVTWLPLGGYMMLLHQYTNQAATAFDYRTLLCTYLGIGLLGSVYVALGCFASALTRSQLIAAAVSYGMGITIFLLSLRSLVPIPMAGWQAKVFTYISLTEHLEDFSRGIIDTSNLVFYLSLTGMFLFLTLKVVESRRWK